MIIKENLNQKIVNPEDVSNLLYSLLKTEDKISREREHFWVIGLNSRNIVKYIELVSLGTLNKSIIHPREIFRIAIIKGIASIILGHNHPSGETEPSKDDLAITERLIEAGEILGIKIEDHVIIWKIYGLKGSGKYLGK